MHRFARTHFSVRAGRVAIRPRRSRRVGVAGSVTIHYPGRTVTAAILDLSVCGCRLRVDSGRSLPPKVTVSFPTDRLDVPARVAWQRDDEVGLEFAHAARGH